jgi:hypothetical protein
VPDNSAPTTSIDDDVDDEREGCENDDNSGHGRCGDDEADPDDDGDNSGPGGGDDDDDDDHGDSSGHGGGDHD